MASYRVGHYAVLVVAVVGGIIGFRRNAALLLLTTLGLALTVQFARNAFEAMILAIPASAIAVDRLSTLARTRGARLLADVTAPLVAMTICVAQVAAAPEATLIGPLGFGVVERLFAVDTLITLRRLPVHRLINDFPIGGYLIWENVPGGVYIDGRTVALYTEEDVKSLFLPLFWSDETLTAAADKWGAVYGLANNGKPPYHWMMVSQEWAPVHIGIGTSLFVRRHHAAELPPDLKPLHLVRAAVNDDWTREWYVNILKEPDLRTTLLSQFKEAARRGPKSPILVDIVRTVAALDPVFAASLEDDLVKAREETAQ